jgi:hypothetical protein
MAELTGIRETVRDPYAAAAKTAADAQAQAGCCNPDLVSRSPADETACSAPPCTALPAAGTCRRAQRLRSVAAFRGR